MKKKKTIGLALGSGGARGFAHIGVLKILEENNIPIDYISGTSMGALIGALYASGMNADELEKEMKKVSKSWKNLFDYNLIPKNGLIRGDKIEKWIKSKLKVKTFEELKIPLFVSALDIKSNQEIIFNSGNLAKAIRSSISIPGIFTPVIHKKRLLVDGGLIDPIPSEILSESGADVIIAVNVNDFNKKERILSKANFEKVDTSKLPNLTYILSESLKSSISTISSMDSEGDEIDYLINIPLENVGMFEFEKIDEAISFGEMVTKKSIEKIKKIIGYNIIKKISKYAEIVRESSIVSKIEEQVKDIEKTII